MRNLAVASVFLTISLFSNTISANENFPTGLANGSDQVGRNFMNHNCSAVVALHPFRWNKSVYQKTLMMNDYYLANGKCIYTTL